MFVCAFSGPGPSNNAKVSAFGRGLDGNRLNLTFATPEPTFADSNYCTIWEFFVCPCFQSTPQANKGDPMVAGDE